MRASPNRKPEKLALYSVVAPRHVSGQGLDQWSFSVLIKWQGYSKCFAFGDTTVRIPTCTCNPSFQVHFSGISGKFISIPYYTRVRSEWVTLTIFGVAFKIFWCTRVRLEVLAYSGVHMYTCWPGLFKRWITLSIR